MKQQVHTERGPKAVRPEPFAWLLRKRCHYCGSVGVFVSNFPALGQYTCEPCYLLEVKAPHAKELIIQCVDSPYRRPRHRFLSPLRECIKWLLRRLGIGILRKLGLL